MDKKIRILGIAGSLRKGSYNKAILNASVDIARNNAEVIIFDELGAIPSFSQDAEISPPTAVKILKDEIQKSDAILFSTPEYNYSIPGVLKNAIDWASRPYGKSAWDGKPVAMMTASTGMLGGARVQYQLRQVFVFLNMFPLNKPEIIIPTVNEKINDEGILTDMHTKEKIKELLDALIAWTKRLKQEIILPKENNVETYEYDNHYARSHP